MVRTIFGKEVVVVYTPTGAHWDEDGKPLGDTIKVKATLNGFELATIPMYLVLNLARELDADEVLVDTGAERADIRKEGMGTLLPGLIGSALKVVQGRDIGGLKRAVRALS